MVPIGVMQTETLCSKTAKTVLACVSQNYLLILR